MNTRSFVFLMTLLSACSDEAGSKPLPQTPDPPTSQTPDRPTSKGAPDRYMNGTTPEVIDHLVSNKDPSKRYAANKSLDDGLADLRTMVASDRIAEIWMYVPALERWEEVGIPMEIGVNSNPIVIIQYVGRHDTIELFYTQPPSKEARKATRGMSPEEKKQHDRFHSFIPNPVHILELVQDTNLHNRYREKGYVQSTIVTRFGELSYRMTKNGIRRFAQHRGPEALFAFRDAKHPEFLAYLHARKKPIGRTEREKVLNAFNDLYGDYARVTNLRIR